MYEYGDVLVMKNGFTCKVVYIYGNRITIEFTNESGVFERYCTDIERLRKPVKVIHATRRSERR